MSLFIDAMFQGRITSYFKWLTQGSLIEWFSATNKGTDT